MTSISHLWRQGHYHCAALETVVINDDPTILAAITRLNRHRVAAGWAGAGPGSEEGVARRPLLGRRTADLQLPQLVANESGLLLI